MSALDPDAVDAYLRMGTREEAQRMRRAVMERRNATPGSSPSISSSDLVSAIQDASSSEEGSDDDVAYDDDDDDDDDRIAAAAAEKTPIRRLPPGSTKAGTMISTEPLGGVGGATLRSRSRSRSTSTSISTFSSRSTPRLKSRSRSTSTSAPPPVRRPDGAASEVFEEDVVVPTYARNERALVGEQYGLTPEVVWSDDPERMPVGRIKRIQAMRVHDELRPLLRTYGLRTGGTKRELVARVVQHEVVVGMWEGGSGEVGETEMEDGAARGGKIESYEEVGVDDLPRMSASELRRLCRHWRVSTARGRPAMIQRLRMVISQGGETEGEP